MYITKLLEAENFNASKRTRLILYKSPPVKLEEKYITQFENIYKFENCEYILTFLETQDRQAIFIGAYKKLGVTNYDSLAISREYPYPQLCGSYYCFYKFERINIMEEMINRLVIYWGEYKKRSKCLQENEAEIIRVLPKGD